MRKRKRGEGLVQEILILVALGTERWEEGYKQNTSDGSNLGRTMVVVQYLFV